MAQTGGIHIVDLVDDVEHFRNTRTRRNMYRLQEAGLRSVLLREDLRGLPVVLVSVAGAFRGGKSFLLNYFIRYLTAMPSSRADGSWVGAAGQPLTGFDWAPGIERNTTGIQLWPEPFFMQKDDGTRVAVLLMDTQGTFDSQSTLRDSSTVFALSTLISSLQIYNLKHQINDCDLMNLEAFTKYGIYMKQSTGEAFQELKFLVRDWENDWQLSYGDGEDGGARYKNIVLQVTESQPEQVKRIRESITNSFEVISCFLMPLPGREVSRPTFRTNPGELDPDFKRELVNLTHSIFSPEKLRIKLLGGQPVSAEILFELIKTYVDSFNSDALPEPLTIYEAQSEASLSIAMNAAIDLFESRVSQETTLSMPEAVLIQLHEALLNEALAFFDSRRLFGGQIVIHNKREQLRTNLSNRLEDIKTRNNARTLTAVSDATAAYDAVIELLRQNQRLCVHVRDLERAHEEALATATLTFDGSRRRLSNDQTDPDRQRLLADCEAKYESNLRINEFNNMAFSEAVQNEYNTFMMVLCTQTPRLNEAAFEAQHVAQRDRALEQFDQRRNRPNQYPQDIFKDRLRQNIEEKYRILRILNSNTNAALVYLALMQYHVGLVTVEELRDLCLHPQALKDLHRQGITRALATLRPGRSADQGFNLNDPDERMLQNLIRTHYDTLVDINKSANENAVEIAFKAYKDKFDELTNYFGYFTASWDKAKGYHQQALDVAHDVFYRNRRNRDSYGDDPYITLLDAKCEKYYNPEGKTKHGFRKFMAGWGAAMEQITRDEYLTLPDDYPVDYIWYLSQSSRDHDSV